ALLQIAERLILGIAGTGDISLPERLGGIAHRLFSLTEALRQISGAIADILHQLAEGVAQRFLGTDILARIGAVAVRFVAVTIGLPALHEEIILQQLLLTGHDM